jgi:MFS family permease
MAPISSSTKISAGSKNNLPPPSSASSSLLEWNVRGLCLVFATPMLGGFLYGFDIGATSFVLSMLLRDTNSNSSNANDNMVVWWSDISSVQQGLLVSALSLGALLGSHLVLMYLSSRIDRRMELRICAALYLVGTCLNVLSGTRWLKFCGIWGFAVLLVGRLIFGMGVGFIMHGAPAYMAEMCPAEIRGAVVSAKETVIVGGIVVGYATGNWMSTDPSDWTGKAPTRRQTEVFCFVAMLVANCLLSIS